MNGFSNGIGNAMCKVCGDRASGRHYGVHSCDGCRGFFKRSIRRNLEYICKEGGKCIVDVSRRNQCQSCRFSKCISANMRREAVQHERAPKVHVGAAVQQSNVHHFNPGGPSLYGSRYLMQDLIFPFPMHLSSHMFPNFPIPLDSYYNPNPYFNMNPLQAMNLKTIDSKYKPNTMPSASYSSEFGKSMNSNVFPDIKTEEKFKCGVIPKEDEVTSSEESIVVTEVQKTTLESTALLLQTTRKILLTAIKWAKSIPSFQQLSIEDQKCLLDICWGDLFVLAAAEHGLTIDEKFSSMNPHLTHFFQVTKNFALLKIDEFETACLKALVLFRVDTLNAVAANQQLSFLQNQILCLLIQKCDRLRFGQLLLLLPRITIAGNTGKLQEIFFKETIDEIFSENSSNN